MEWSYDGILWFLWAGALALGFLARSQGRGQVLEAWDLGLLLKLPVSYFMGLLLSVAALLLSALWRRGQAISTMLLALAFFAPGWLLSPLPRWWDAYYIAGQLNRILEAGRLFPSSSAYPPAAYHAWPVFHLIIGQLRVVTGVPVLTLMRLVPLLMLGVLLTLVASLHVWLSSLRQRPPTVAWNAIALALLGMWTPFDYMGPPFLALLILYTVLIMIGRLDLNEGRSVVLVSIGWVSLILTHGITGVGGSVAIAAYLLLLRHGLFAAFGMLVLVLWLLIIPLVFEVGVLGVRTILLNPLMIFDLFQRSAALDAPVALWTRAVQTAQLTTGLLWGAIGLLGLVSVLRDRRGSRGERTLWLVATVLVATIGTGLGVGGTFTIDGPYRAYFVALPLVGALSLTRLRLRNWVTISLLLMVFPTSWVARYGYEHLQSPRPEVLASARWLKEHRGITGAMFIDKATAFFAGLYLPDVVLPGGSVAAAVNLDAARTRENVSEFPLMRGEIPLLFDRQSIWRLTNYRPRFQAEDLILDQLQSRSLVYGNGLADVFGSSGETWIAR